MVSSESGEDFESADEDFDLDNPSKHKVHNKSSDTVGKVKKPSEGIDVSIKSKTEITEKIAEKTDESSITDADSNLQPNIEPEITNTLHEVQSSTHSYIETISKSSLTESTPTAVPFTSMSKIEEFDPSEVKTSIEENVQLLKEDKEVKQLIQSSENLHLDAEADEINTSSLDGWDVEDELEIPEIIEAGRYVKTAHNIPQPIQKEVTPREEDQGWGGWGGWGVSSILSTATDSVSTLSSQVSAGFSTIIETTVGAPPPESLSFITNEAEKPTKLDDICPRDDSVIGFGGIGSLVSGVSIFGSSVINRGLDTLETLGKKTMEVLQEGDPGLMKKRALLFPNQDKPVLSQILRDAKEKAESSDKEKEEKETARKVHFESLFDDFQGLVHLEALEMLSTQCELKLQSLLLSQSGPQLLDLQETLSQVRDLCELPEDEEDSSILTNKEFSEKVTNYVKGLNINTTAAKLIQVNDTITDRLSTLTSEIGSIVNQTAISSMAEFTAAGMELYHKSAELLLAKSIRNTPDEAENYVELTTCLCARVSAMANEFTQLLTKTDPIANSSMITSIFLEASNSCSYIKNSCQLLIPILQDGAVSS